MSRIKIIQESELGDGESVAFSFQRDGKKIDAFLIRFEGLLHAYENVCRHLPVGLDYADGQFFNREKNFLICRTHGALYHPVSGKCVQGPCGGESLFPLNIEVEDGAVWLTEEGAEPS
jgi:nitrite reductase/ring-hydroxylating ferredoxin subunit